MIRVKTIMCKFIVTNLAIVSLIGCKSQSSSENKPLPLKTYMTKINRTTNVAKYLDEQQWNELFPNRCGLVQKDSVNSHTDFYSFSSFKKASEAFPGFLSGSDETEEKRELAAFLANIAQETSGGWQNAPGGYFKYGLYFREELDKSNSYVDTSNRKYLPVTGKYYFGRGPKQLTWNYNYGQFSEAWFGTKDSLLMNPEWLSENPVLSFASAIWFWMTSQPPKPSCHDIMVGKWIPTEDDIRNNRLPGFGATVNVINGGVECGNGVELEKTHYRYEYYKYFCTYFKVRPGENISCVTQKPFGPSHIK